jgi:mannose-6-phosphate isomerase-like protein (cupin superfamily)
MKILERRQLASEALKGRAIQKAIGSDAHSESKRMTVGYAKYADAYGPMDPHRHAEETVYVLSSDRGWVRFGKTRNALTERVTLEGGELLHIPEGEWHVFQHEPGGHVDIIFIYGQVDNIRPESSDSEGAKK